MENAGMTASKSASKPVHNITHTSVEYKCNGSSPTLCRVFVKTLLNENPKEMFIYSKASEHHIIKQAQNLMQKSEKKI